MSEADRVKERYERRASNQLNRLYVETNPSNLRAVQERERTLVALVNRHLAIPVEQARVLEVGCGSGSNLATLVRFGFDPGHLTANELLEERVEQARRRLPAAVNIVPGDATTLDLPEEGFDIVYQSTVFTSLLDDATQRKLAEYMWRWTKPGGGVLWYDFTYNNPRNPDVRGVPLARIRELFPQAVIDARRITLAPPIARRIPANLYGVFNSLPLLRTHLMCWLAKPAPSNSQA